MAEISKNVKGQPFEITIKADKKKAKSTTYSDDDKDGIIYIKSIDAGKYDIYVCCKNKATKAKKTLVIE